jgi:(p)ppGpp synthase/HD superfamily hydrolase
MMIVIKLKINQYKGGYLVELIDKALAVSALAHKDQVRKGTIIPYIIHPFHVGLLLQQEGCSVDVICAGILHDTVEDTDLTIEDIKRQFNNYIARIVEGCSELNKADSWENRKLHTINRVKSIDKDTGMVICADKIHNLQSILADKKVVGEDIWLRFNRGRPQQEWYYKELLVSFRENKLMKSANLVSMLEKAVNELINS